MTSAIASGSTDNRASQLRFHGYMPVHGGAPFHLVVAAPLLENGDFDYELISGSNRMAEPALVDSGKIDQFGVPIPVAAQQ